MKKEIKRRALLVLLVASFAANVSMAAENQSILPETQVAQFQSTESMFETSRENLLAKKEDNLPLLQTPKVEEPRKVAPKKSGRKVDLKAIIFDPNANFQAQATEEDREMTKLEEAQYNVHEALHGEVKKLSTKGLLADKLKIKFDEGPIDNIQPWVDYNGYFSNVWSGDNYQNSLYTIYFADVGFHVNMKDDRYHAKFMISPVKGFDNKTYFQALFADNFIDAKLGKKKNNTLLLGNTWLPIGFEGQESPLVWQYFGRSQTSLKYSSVRTLGAKLSGNYKYANYHLGFYSAGRGFTDWFPGPETAAWVEFKPTANIDEKKYGKLTVGAGFNAGNAASHYAVGTGGIKYEYKRFKAISEFGIADGSNGALGYTANKSKGINGTVSYRVTPKTEVSFRYDQFDPNTQVTNDSRKEYTVGFNYYLKDYAARFMINAVLYSLEKGTYGSRLMVGTQIVL